MLLPGVLLGPAAAAGVGQEAAGPGHTQLLQKLRLPGSRLAKRLGHGDKQHGSRSQREVVARQAGVQTEAPSPAEEDFPLQLWGDSAGYHSCSPVLP